MATNYEKYFGTQEQLAMYIDNNTPALAYVLINQLRIRDRCSVPDRCKFLEGGVCKFDTLEWLQEECGDRHGQ